MQKVTPCLWFDTNAEEAINFYISLFPNSKMVSMMRYPDEVPEEFMKGMEGKVLTGIFELNGYRFMALDGGPLFKLNPSISFHVKCTTKDEVDAYWNKLIEGGTALMELGEYPFSERYGWVQDKFGVSWQVIYAGPAKDSKQTITPVLMYVGDVAGKAEEAIKLYTSVFPDSKSTILARYEKGEEPDKEGTVKYAAFEIFGEEFGAMDSAYPHEFAFNEAISFEVECENQEEVDAYWEKLSAVPASEQCGWIKDKYGVSWQIIPKRLGELLSDPDKEKSGRVLKAMLAMKKIDVEKLEEAAKG